MEAKLATSEYGEAAIDAFRRFERAGWQEIAQPYDRLLGPITSRAVEPLLDAAGVVAGIHVLDVATGPGYAAAAAARRGANVMGVDIAPAMVALARVTNPDVQFRQADAENLPFADGTFDAVVGNFALLHLARPEQAARELARVATGGGRVALTVWDVPERTRFLGVVLDAVAAVTAATPADLPAGPPFFRFAEEAEFARLLGSAGLREVRVDTLAFDQAFADADDLWMRILGATVRTRALIAHQPPQVQQRIRRVYEQLVDRYRERDCLHVPVSVKLAVGVRPRLRPS